MWDRKRRVGAATGGGGARGCTIAAAAITAVFGIGCGGESGSCGGEGSLDGVYVSSDPAVSMTVLECDGEVSGSLTLAGVRYDVEGTRIDDEFAWSTSTADLCAGSGIRRRLFTRATSPNVVDDEAQTFTGSFRLQDANCATGRAFIRGFTTTFERI